MGDPQDTATPQVVVRPPILVATAIVFGLAAQAIQPANLLGSSLLGPIIGGAFIVAGLALGGWSAFLFGRAGTNVPTSRPSRALVAHGPYRLSRNPIYCGLVAILAGLSLVLDNIWMLTTVPILAVVLDIWVIRREEAYLSARFGVAYDDFRSKTRRWL